MISCGSSLSDSWDLWDPKRVLAQRALGKGAMLSGENYKTLVESHACANN